MSKHQKLLKYLEGGNVVTNKQITGYFGIKNASRAVHYLREQGYCVYGNKSRLTDGTETVRYRLGRPSRQMVRIANQVFGSAVFNK